MGCGDNVFPAFDMVPYPFPMLEVGDRLRVVPRPVAAVDKAVLDMRINWKDVLKFLSGGFFVTAGASWYFWWYQISVPTPFGLTMTPEFLGIRGFLHFALFLISFYFGFIKR